MASVDSSAGGSVGASAGLASEAGALTVADAWGAEDGASGCWARAGSARAIATAAQKIKQVPGCANWVRFLMNNFDMFGITMTGHRTGLHFSWLVTFWLRDFATCIQIPARRINVNIAHIVNYG